MGPNPIVSFRAGIVHRDGRMMRPDARQGMVRITTTPPNVSIVWQEEGKDPEINVVVMAHVNHLWKLIGDPNSRVYTLKLIGSDRLFFWLQEPDKSRDDNLAQNIRSALAPTSVPMDTGEPSGVLDALTAERLQQLIGQISTGPNLGDVLTADTVSPILDSLASDPNIHELIEQLPPGMQSVHELKATFRSPQFMQAVQMLEVALSQGQLQNIAIQCGIDPSIVHPFGGVKEFLEALIQTYAPKHE